MKGYWMASMMEARIKQKSKDNKKASRKHFQNQGKQDGINDGNKENEVGTRKKHIRTVNKETILGFRDIGWLQ